ncbi:MAG: POTRA domain-containing protein [Pyrinomonadaceae bacterium]
MSKKAPGKFGENSKPLNLHHINLLKLEFSHIRLRADETLTNVGKNGGKTTETVKTAARFLHVGFVLCALISIFILSAHSQNKYENRKIERVDITFEGNDRDLSASEQFRLLAREEVGELYSAVKIRNAIEELYNTGRIVSVQVEATNFEDDKVLLRFIVKRKTLAKKVSVIVEDAVGEPVTEEELLLRLNLLTAGSAISERVLVENANSILTYLRERGYYDAEVTYDQKLIGNAIDTEVIFDVKPKTQARIGKFEIDIGKFDETAVSSDLELQPGAPFSLQTLMEDVDKVRAALREETFLAPILNEPRIVYDSDKNLIDIELRGDTGAKVNVVVDVGEETIGEKTQTRLLPIKREGTIDYAAIVEGERRLESYYQERGYFFATVTPYCSVKPEFRPDEASETENETEVLCTALSGADLNDREVEVKYEVDLNRRLKLVAIRLEGTDKFTIPEIRGVLESQEASILGFIPFFGYGNGYTSNDLLLKDKDTVESLLRELGYRNARVGIKQGVSPEGEDLIITFVVREGIPTLIEDVEIVGNTSFSDDVLRKELPELVGKNYSRARVRNGVRKLSEYYANLGYFDARVTYSTTEYPNEDDATEDKIKITYRLENEGKKVIVNRVLINGNEDTKTKAILKAIDIKPETGLRIADIFSSEQNLYATDAFDRVEIKPEPAGETPDGQNRQTDVIINVEEKKPRLITYGGGYSTDVGLSGFFDIRHFNLFGSLQQGGAQIRWSQRRQLAQIDFFNPRFIPDGKNENGQKRYAPITFTAQYQRDSTVTRFFRSTFDQGTFGIVQRIDENGNPIDEFGNAAGDPTINRFTISAETNRTISKKDRSILFVKYRFEDVRLFSFESLLIKELLRPDARVRISGFGATFVRDTRKNCSITYTILDFIAKGEPGDPCRYNAGDPTNGEYLTAEYNVSLPALGANIGFNKFQLNYNRYYTFPKVRTTLAGRFVLGMASVFSGGDRFSQTQFPGLTGALPISERFFAGGSTTLRGFDFESAGPRIAVVPQGIFRNQQGEIVTLNPFTIPFGGNAMAIVNLEARIPVSESIRIVPFYDGGNVFNKVGDIFKRSETPPNNVFDRNLRSVWSNTVGLGVRIKTPIGGEFAVDYGYLLKPPSFVIPQQNPPDAIYRLPQGQLHFRFSQAF